MTRDSCPQEIRGFHLSTGTPLVSKELIRRWTDIGRTYSLICEDLERIKEDLIDGLRADPRGGSFAQIDYWANA